MSVRRPDMLGFKSQKPKRESNPGRKGLSLGHSGVFLLRALNSVPRGWPFTYSSGQHDSFPRALNK